jgi:Bacterial transglutaminase-like cysteine proteinase BTLCP
LLKRRILMQAGWPREALLVTVVDKGKTKVTPCTVTTDKGDYVLDNLNKNILLWSATGYRFVKRQSQPNPNVWVSLDRQPTIVTADSNSFAPRHHELARLWHDQGKVLEAREGRTYPASDCRRERGYGANW